MRKSRRPADGPKHSYCFLLSHSHKLQVRLVRAGSHCCLENLQSFSPHMLLSLGPRTLTLSNINPLNDLQRQEQTGFLLHKKGEEKETPTVEHSGRGEAALWWQCIYTWDGAKDTVIGGTVLPPRQLGRVGELQEFPGEEKQTKWSNQQHTGIITVNEAQVTGAEGSEILVHVYKYILCMHSHLCNIHFFKETKVAWQFPLSPIQSMT